MAKAMYQGQCQVRNRPATMATRHIIDRTDKSMPQVMITTVMPSAMMPKGAKLRVTLATFSEVPKLGSMAVIKMTRAISAIVTQKDWLEITRWRGVCSLVETKSDMAGVPAC